MDATTPLSPPKTRLVSIDALRGFDMLLIVGGGTFLVLLKGLTGIPAIDWLADQLEHPAWGGFTFYDFVFPLFLFITGTSIPFSLGSKERTPLMIRDARRRAFRRMILLILIGILYSNAPLPVFEPSEIRLSSVLGRIGIAGFCATLLYLHAPGAARFWVIAVILAGYYLCLAHLAVPGYQAADYTLEGNLAGMIDRAILPGRLAQGSFDELGILTTFPAICLTILGTIAGDILKRDIKPSDRLMRLIFLGMACLGLGLVWSLDFPVIKPLWTSSYILVTGGMSFLAMALFYWLIDMQRWTRFGFVFQVIGVNSLLIYLMDKFVSANYTVRKLFGALYAPLPEAWQGPVIALLAVIVTWLVLLAFYRAKLILKI